MKNNKNIRIYRIKYNREENTCSVYGPSGLLIPLRESIYSTISSTISFLRREKFLVKFNYKDNRDILVKERLTGMLATVFPDQFIDKYINKKTEASSFTKVVFSIIALSNFLHVDVVRYKNFLDKKSREGHSISPYPNLREIISQGNNYYAYNNIRGFDRYSNLKIKKVPIIFFNFTEPVYHLSILNLELLALYILFDGGNYEDDEMDQYDIENNNYLFISIFSKYFNEFDIDFDSIIEFFDYSNISQFEVKKDKLYSILKKIEDNPKDRSDLFSILEYNFGGLQYVHDSTGEMNQIIVNSCVETFRVEYSDERNILSNIIKKISVLLFDLTILNAMQLNEEESLFLSVRHDYNSVIVLKDGTNISEASNKIKYYFLENFSLSVELKITES